MCPTRPYDRYGLPVDQYRLRSATGKRRAVTGLFFLAHHPLLLAVIGTWISVGSHMLVAHIVGVTNAGAAGLDAATLSAIGSVVASVATLLASAVALLNATRRRDRDENEDEIEARKEREEMIRQVVETIERTQHAHEDRHGGPKP